MARHLARFAPQSLLALFTAATPALAFIDGAPAPDAAELKRRLDDRGYNVQLANGLSWKLTYQANGYFFVDVSNGARAKGTWKTEDGRICTQLQGNNASCNDVRLVNDVLHLKRDSGEIIQLLPR